MGKDLPKLLFAVFALSVVSAGTSSAQFLDLAPQSVSDQLLVDILNNSSVQSLNELPDGEDRSLVLRLYAVPHEGACIAATHMVCSHDYYLAISEYDARQAVYRLGRVGEVTHVRWRDSQVRETGWPPREGLELVVSNYPTYAFKINSKLVPEHRTYHLDVGVDSVGVRLVP